MSTQDERDASTDRLLKAVLRAAPAPAGPGCVDAERLAAWADGVIYGQDAADIEVHLADCARCQALMAAFARSESADAAPGDVVPSRARTPAPIVFTPRRTLRWFVPIAAGTAAAMLLVWTAVGSRTDLTVPDTSVAKVETAPPSIPQASTANVAGAGRQTGGATAETLPASRPATAQPGAPAPVTGPPQSPVAAPPPKSMVAAPPATLPLPSTGFTGKAVLAAPPPPAAAASPAARGAATTPAGSDLARADSKAASLSQAVESLEVTFSSPAIDPGRGNQAAGGGGGGRGGGGMRTAAQAAAKQVRWLVQASGRILRSATDGATWEAVTIDPTAKITGGVAPSASVCWLIGRAGAVMRSEDGFKFTRVQFPDAVDLKSITAVDDREATVIAADGGTYKTTDGGATWRRGGF